MILINESRVLCLFAVIAGNRRHFLSVVSVILLLCCSVLRLQHNTTQSRDRDKMEASSKRTIAEEDASHTSDNESSCLLHKRQKQQTRDREAAAELAASTAGKRKRALSTSPLQENRGPTHNGAWANGDDGADHEAEEGDGCYDELQLEQQRRKRAANPKAPNKRSISELTADAEDEEEAADEQQEGKREDGVDGGGDVHDKRSRGGGRSSNFHGSTTPAFEGDLSHLIVRRVDLARWPLDCVLQVQRSSQRVTSELFISRHWDVLWLKAMIGQLVHLNVWEIHLTLHGQLLEDHKRLIDYAGAATLEAGCRLKVHLVADEHADPASAPPPVVVQAMAARQHIAPRQTSREDVLRNFGDSISL